MFKERIKMKKRGSMDGFPGIMIVITIIILILALIPIKNRLNNIADDIEIKSKVRVEATVDKNEKTTELKSTMFSMEFTQHDLVDEYKSEISYNDYKRKYTDNKNYEKFLEQKTISAYLYTITFKERDYKILSINDQFEKDDIVLLNKELKKDNR